MTETSHQEVGYPTSIGRATVAELVATFAFVLVSSGAIVATNVGIDQMGAALATGLALGVAVSGVSHLSGGHVNPAVTIGLWVTGKIEPTRAVAYIFAQLLGAILGALLLRFLVPSFIYDATGGGVPTLSPVLGVGKGIAIEATITFILVFVFFGTLVDARGGWSKTGGIIIGLAAASNVMVFGPYTGAAMNPARWLGPAFAAQLWSDWYVWIAGPLVGGILAALLYRGIFLHQPVPRASAAPDGEAPTA